MAIFTQHVAEASVNLPWGESKKGLAVVVDDAQNNRILAYCPRLEDAERIKALLVYSEPAEPQAKKEQ